MSHVKLVWATPDIEEQLVYIARVSNPKMQGEPSEKLLPYCIKHQHWSPFEMANVVLEMNTTRDIGRQVLRHRSFAFQEFSQRYAEVDLLGDFELSEPRLQDYKNRQNSIDLPKEKEYLKTWWAWKQNHLIEEMRDAYKKALEHGIAKEVARKILPEGLTPTRFYMNGTVRSWIHYCQLRTGNGTQKEHMELAQQASDVLAQLMPNVWKAINENSGN